jgi:hypothetical protein
MTVVLSVHAERCRLSAHVIVMSAHPMVVHAGDLDADFSSVLGKIAMDRANNFSSVTNVHASG